MSLRPAEPGPGSTLQPDMKLNDAGHGPVATDGVYGPATAAAVRRFQAANGLTADGIVGQQTWAAFDRVPAHA